MLRPRSLLHRTRNVRPARHCAGETCSHQSPNCNNLSKAGAGDGLRPPQSGPGLGWVASTMRTVLCIAEKNSAAREIVNVMCTIANATKLIRPGRNPTFEFVYPVQGIPCKILFTAVAGHIKSTVFDDDSGTWGRRPHIDLLDVNKSKVSWAVMDDKMDLAEHIRRVSRSADLLVLWLDCDSEGEKIAADVADVCKQQKPGLPVRRARFSAMTRPEIMRAWRSLVDLNARVIAMVEVRQELDHRAGWAFSRFLTDRARGFAMPANGGSENTVISYGPCQSPALGLVVDRQLTIDNFQRRPFWIFRLRLQDCDCTFEWARCRLFEEIASHVLYELCVEDTLALNNLVRVERVDSQPRTRMRPVPLSTIELQKAASRLMRISSDRSVKAAEALYASGLISYPRTETDEFESSYDLRSVVQMQTQHADWGAFAARLLTPATPEDPMTFCWPRTGGNNDHAHPPIHPTAPPPSSFPDADQRAVYEYISRRFLAACSIDARGSETKVQIRVGRAELFGARGLVVQIRGYLEVMRYDKWTDRKMPTQLLEVGNSIRVCELSLQASETQPPPLLSEADLISLMDRHGIGTDATIAQHVEKIVSRGYVSRQGDGRFKPNPLGFALVEALERSRVQLARPGMRKAQEAEFKKVQSGTADNVSVKLEALAQFRTNFDRLLANTVAVSASFGNHFEPSAAVDVSQWTAVTQSFSLCGICGRMMALKTRNVGNNEMYALYCGHCPPVSSYLLSRNVGNKQYAAAQGEGHICPICDFQVVCISNSETHAEHRICPFCLHKPPSDALLNPKDVTAGQFRCFACSHSSCPNAKGIPLDKSNVAICPDSSCNETCDIRTSVRGGQSNYRISCSSPQSSSCSWRPYFFPRAVEGVVAVENEDGACPSCGSRQLIVKWKRSSVPAGAPSTFMGCIWCDRAYKDILNRSGDGYSIPTFPHPGAPAAADLEGYGRGRGRGRGRGQPLRGSAVGGRRGGGGTTGGAASRGRGSRRGNQASTPGSGRGRGTATRRGIGGNVTRFSS
jgi:DNA topoisomerase III